MPFAIDLLTTVGAEQRFANDRLFVTNTGTFVAGKRTINVVRFFGVEFLPTFKTSPAFVLAVGVPLALFGAVFLHISQVPFHYEWVATVSAVQGNRRLAVERATTWTTLYASNLARLNTKIGSAYTTVLDHAGTFTGVNKYVFSIHIPISIAQVFYDR